MNWDAIGAIGEIIGAIAVVVSLVYLAIQIRQNTQQISQGNEATRLAALERNIESSIRIRELLISNSEVAEIFQSGLRNYDALDNASKFRFGLLMSNTLSAFQGGYLRQLAIGADPLNFEGTARLVDSILKYAGARQWLAQNEPDWRPEFRDFIEERLEALDEKSGGSTGDEPQSDSPD